jgi:CheY-like chemotaxis protein/ABC-type transporter Mla MlaB component
MALKVLTVDDSKTIRMIVKKAFKSFDSVVFEAENGVEGLTVASKEKPDLIVLDITMPVMNGVEMLNKLKSEPDLKEIPVIMLTAESGKDNVMQIVKMGVRDYMVKPFKGEQLIERVEKIVKLEPRKEEEPSEDLSKRYFSMDGDIQVLLLPGKVDRQVGVQVESYLKGKIKDMVKAGNGKLIMDLSKVTQTNVSLIKLIILVIQRCQMSKIHVRVVGTPALSSELKEFAETSEIPIYNTIEDAKAGL